MKVKTIESKLLGEAYYKLEHGSGLTIYVMPKKNCKSCYALFGTNYGSIDTCFCVKGEEMTSVPEGIAHFLEHKLFESDELGAFERYSKTGADANAYTSFDKTCYLFSCSDNFSESLEILLDFVKSPYFTDETVKKEQGIIGQEIRMYQDNPDWQALFNLLRAMYKENPVRIDVGGTVDSIAQINSQLLYKCYNTFYNNSNMVLAVTGNVTLEQVTKVADRCLKNEKKVEIVRKAPNEPEEIVTSYVEQNMGVKMCKFNLGFKEKPFDGSNIKKSATMLLALEMIAGKMTGFYTRLLEGGLINPTFFAEPIVGRGFACYVFGGESDDPQKLKKEILQRIKLLRENGVDPETFEAVKRTRYGVEIKSFENISSLAEGLVNSHFDGYNIFDTFKAYKEITVEDVNSLIKESFDETKCVLSVIK